MTQKPSAKRGYLWMILGLLIAAIIIRSFFDGERRAPVSMLPAASAVAPPLDPARTAKSKADADAADKAFNRKKTATIGMIMLKSRMRNPDSFQLMSVLAMPKGQYCYEYRAQNGFGGMNVEDAVFYGSMQLSTGEDVWNKYCAGKAGDDFTHDVELLLAASKR